MLIDFGSGTLELKVKTKKSLDDGEWHKIDVFWDTEVRFVHPPSPLRARAILLARVKKNRSFSTSTGLHDTVERD